MSIQSLSTVTRCGSVRKAGTLRFEMWLAKSLEPHCWIQVTGPGVITMKNDYRQGQKPVRIKLSKDNLTFGEQSMHTEGV